MRTLLSFLLLMGLCAQHSAQDLGSPTGRTPYDGYLGPMRSVLGSLGSNKPSLDEVKQYVRTGKSFRYYMKDPYVPQMPAETEATKAGDCKAKSLWVASKMDDRTVRYVIGKARAVSQISHAWLMWPSSAGWFILDATNYSSPLAANRVSRDEFMPMYSYSAGGKYAHTITTAPKAKPEAKYGDHM
jgi:hypothetical protein